jgi:hypothetical protein
LTFATPVGDAMVIQGTKQPNMTQLPDAMGITERR